MFLLSQNNHVIPPPALQAWFWLLAEVQRTKRLWFGRQQTLTSLFREGKPGLMVQWAAWLSSRRVKTMSKGALSPGPGPRALHPCEVPQSWKTTGAFLSGGLEQDLGSWAVTQNANVAVLCRNCLLAAGAEDPKPLKRGSISRIWGCDEHPGSGTKLALGPWLAMWFQASCFTSLSLIDQRAMLYQWLLDQQTHHCGWEQHQE